MKNFSQIGFILATLGSSIGLGHIWRFPYMAGQNGGGAFVLLFLVLALSVGVAMLIGEMLIGHKTKKNTADAFKELDPNPKKMWKYAGLTLFGGPFILTFYCIVLGWVLYYLFVVSFNLPLDSKEAEVVFTSLLTSSLSAQIASFSAILFFTGLIVSFGIEDGIERLNIVLIPLLFVIFIGLLVYAMFQPSFLQAWHFLFDFKYEAINFNVIVAAMGQMCFSLSLGIGIIITYSASTKENQNLLKSALWVTIPGVLISLIAGLMIFTFVYQYDVQAGDEAGLVFQALPIVFSKIGMGGVVISVLFFVGLAFAGITSTVSLLEPSVMFFVQKYQKNRIATTWAIVGCIYMCGLVLILSLHRDYEGIFNIFGQSLFKWVDFSSSAVIMPLGALVGVIFVGWVIKKQNLSAMTQYFLSPRIFILWFYIIRFVAPLIIIVAWVGLILESRDYTYATIFKSFISWVEHIFGLGSN